MTAIDFGQLAYELTRADDALESGDSLLVDSICRQVLDRVDAGLAGAPFEGLIRAVAMHRIGVVQYQLGEDDEATATFAQVDHFLGEAQQSVYGQELIDVLRNTRETSHEQRVELASRPREARIVCYAVCEHGCRCALPPCGYSSQHC